MVKNNLRKSENLYNSSLSNKARFCFLLNLLLLIFLRKQELWWLYAKDFMSKISVANDFKRSYCCTAWWYVLTSRLRHSALLTFRYLKKIMYRQERRTCHCTAVWAHRGVCSKLCPGGGCTSLLWSIGSSSLTESIVSTAYFTFVAWLTAANHHKNFIARKRES